MTEGLCPSMEGTCWCRHAKLGEDQELIGRTRRRIKAGLQHDIEGTGQRSRTGNVYHAKASRGDDLVQRPVGQLDYTSK